MGALVSVLPAHLSSNDVLLYQVFLLIMYTEVVLANVLAQPLRTHMQNLLGAPILNVSVKLRFKSLLFTRLLFGRFHY